MHPDWTFHHIGVACPAIPAARAAYEAIGYEFESAFEDPIQGVRGEFLVGPGPRIELLEDLPGRTTVAPWIARRMPTSYHLAWLVADFDAALAWIVSRGGRAAGDPQPAVAFGMRPIVFVLVKGKSLVELIQA
jgi:methylmalonyl-CoA/ethylmalonyl-CoA epimerase